MAGKAKAYRAVRRRLESGHPGALFSSRSEILLCGVYCLFLC